MEADRLARTIGVPGGGSFCVTPDNWRALQVIGEDCT